MKIKNLLLFGLLAISGVAIAQNQNDYSVSVTAVVSESPAKITLQWPTSSYAVQYSIYKKEKETTTFPASPVATLPASATGYEDANVEIGKTYEYAVLMQATFTTVPNSIFYYAFGAATCGIKVAANESRGNTLIVIDSALNIPLTMEINRLKSDLIGDGWGVTTITIGSGKNPVYVKEQISNWYFGDTVNNKAVLLLGSIPVPYSGNFGGDISPPDGHTPDHNGAWAADVFYAVMRGQWTDFVTNSNANRAENKNLPGDGKYDQSTIPGTVVLQVGRIDMKNLDATGLNYVERTRRYLNKDHDYRMKVFSVPRRSVFEDRLGVFGVEAPGRIHYLNHSPLFGKDSVKQISNTYFAEVKSKAYLFSGITTSAGYTSLNGIGSVTNFADPVYTVFSTYFGSYFADWDINNNFLRGSIAGPGYTLTSCWSGRPVWHFYHMGMGENIGYSAVVSQNNPVGVYFTGISPRGVYMSLHGDPTLRLHVVAPPINPVVKQMPLTSSVNISWSPADEQGILGYFVYRSASADGPFMRISPNAVTDTSFVDVAPFFGNNYYMVRTYKLETSKTGSYYNLSQGVFANLTTTVGLPSISVSSKILLYPNPAEAYIMVSSPFAPNSSTTVSVSDISGKVVISPTAMLDSLQMVSVSELVSGVYFITIQHHGTSNTSMFVKK